MNIIRPIRLLPLLAFAAAWVSPPSRAQALEGEGHSARAFIPDSLDVPAFVPPAPPVEKTVPNIRVDATVTIPNGNSRTLTLLRGQASALPDIPAAVAVAEPRPPQEPIPNKTPEELARDVEERRRHLQFNAEVDENGVSIIHWQHPDTVESYEAICGFDVNLLAGLGHFSCDGKIYQLSFLPPGILIIPRFDTPENPFPKPPAAAAGTITITHGNANDPIGTATVTLLRDLIANEKSRLIVYQEKRTAYQHAAADWQKTHPILPHDETVWLRPHRGSRYLTNPTPEKGSSR